MNAIKQRVEEGRQHWNAGDLAGYLTLYDESIRLHGYTPEPMTKAAVAEFYQQIWSSFGAPLPLEFHETMVEGDLYCCRFTMKGQHNGSFMGRPATGRTVVLPGITMMRFFRGRALVECGFPRPDGTDRCDTGSIMKRYEA